MSILVFTFDCGHGLKSFLAFLLSLNIRLEAYVDSLCPRELMIPCQTDYPNWCYVPDPVAAHSHGLSLS